MIFLIRTMVLAFVAVGLAGCASMNRSFGEAPNIEVTNLEALPEPRDVAIYRIGPQEPLEIVVFGAEALSGKFLTDVNGDVDFPLLGGVSTGGTTPNDAARLIAERLRGRYVVDPKVQVIPERLPQRLISVGGQVERPGEYQAGSNPTLLRVVNQAGGLSEYARKDDILVMRSVSGQNYIGLYNIEAIQRGNYPDPRVFANDIVMVGDSPERRRLDKILQFVPVLTSATIILDRLNR